MRYLLGRTSRLLGLVALFLGVAGVSASTVHASNGSSVSLIGCVINGGSTTVASGEPITIQEPGYAVGTYGLMKDFLSKQQTTLTVSDGTTAVFNLSSEWGAPQQLGRNFWVTRLPDTNLGIALAQGETIVVTFDIQFAHPLLIAYPPVGSSGNNGPFLIREDGPLSCEITGN